MKTSISILLIFIFSIQLYAQNPDVLIVEDYSNPKSYMYFKAPWSKESPIDNKKGLYISKPDKKIEASLSFEKGLTDEQHFLNEMSDMEFTVLRIKGDAADFIRVSVDLGEGGFSSNSKSIQFLYNDQGNWRLNNYDYTNGASFITGGKTTINTSPAANVIRIEHRKDTLRYFMNNQLVVEHILKSKERIYWHNCKILSIYTTIALDKAVFKGYVTPEETQKKLEDEKLKKEKLIADNYAAMGLTVKIKSKTHTLYAYPGWANIFKDAEKYSDLRSNYNGKTPSEIFNEGPNGWLKDESSLYSLNFMFSKTDSSTLEKQKEWFIDLAKNRTGWTTEKIKPLEESIVMPDGRKGLLLFYVCPDTKGMVGGNYFNCNLYLESLNDKTKITTYKVFIEGGNPDLPQKDAIAWKDYFKKVLLTISPN